MLSLGVVIFYSFNQKSKDPGEKLAKQYCSSCHQYPNPSILTKRSWDFLLTDMGFRLGVVDYKPIENTPQEAMMHMTTREKILREANAIPSQPLISKEDWNAIRKYYQQKAPKEALPQARKPQLTNKLDQFELKIPDYHPQAPVFTLARINPQGGFILNNIRGQQMVLLDKKLMVADSYYEPEMIVDVTFNENQIAILAIGDLMGRFIGVGKGTVIQRSTPGYQDMGILIDGLHRPADMEFADLNGDGAQELIVSNFGDLTGNVTVYANGKPLTELINAPGAIKSQVHDFNRDGLPDIAVLLGDARENISIFYNQGNSNFVREEVITCHSAYGHTYFELQDFNQDGHVDILAVNGDTDADPFNTLKNYHGIRIYLNDGKNQFDLKYFYPMYGAHFAKAADFDNDGDLDIAGSAFFPDFGSDEPEQFVYLENNGSLKFKPFTHPETHKGRWMTMDIGDYDLDGDTDILLAGGYIPLGMMVDYADKYRKLVNNGKALLVLENTLF